MAPSTNILTSDTHAEIMHLTPNDDDDKIEQMFIKDDELLRLSETLDSETFNNSKRKLSNDDNDDDDDIDDVDDDNDDVDDDDDNDEDNADKVKKLKRENQWSII